MTDPIIVLGIVVWLATSALVCLLYRRDRIKAREIKEEAEADRRIALHAAEGRMADLRSVEEGRQARSIGPYQYPDVKRWGSQAPLYWWSWDGFEYKPRRVTPEEFVSRAEEVERGAKALPYSEPVSRAVLPSGESGQASDEEDRAIRSRIDIEGREE